MDYMGPFTIDAKLMAWEEFKVIIYALVGAAEYPIRMYSYEAVESEADMHESEEENDYQYDRSKEGWEAFIRGESSKKRYDNRRVARETRKTAETLPPPQQWPQPSNQQQPAGQSPQSNQKQPQPQQHQQQNVGQSPQITPERPKSFQNPR